VTEFTETETRKMCRHWRMRLPAPTSNKREAFCTKGCYGSFYLHRCLVCEDKIERTTANRKICKKSKCRNALKAGEGFGRYHADSARTYQSPKNPELMQEVPVPQRPASASGIVAGSNRVCANFGVDQAIRANRARIVGPKRVLDVEIGGRKTVVSPDGVVCYVTSLRRPAMKAAA
jgi:hypothetical protein